MNEVINAALAKLVVPIETLREDPENARRHPEKNLKALEASLLRFGQQKPVVAMADGTLLAGSGTLRAALRLGWTPLAAIKFDSADAARAKAYAIADNRTADLAEWEAPVLAKHLDELQVNGFNLESDLQFEPVDIREILTEFEKAKPATRDEDPVPTPPRKPVSKPGSLWIMGTHALLCGDSMRKEDVKRLMDGEKSDLVYTDPPYNVAYGENKNPKHKHRKIANDKLDGTAWAAFNAGIIDAIKAHHKGGDVYIWGASSPEGMRQRLWLAEAGFHWSATIIWKKNSLILVPANYQRIYEPCFYGWLKKSTFRGDRKQVELWEIDRPTKSDLHPTMKPIALAQRAFNNSSAAGDLVLDLFGGAGSTLIAAEMTGRRCRMMELEPGYCDVIVARWEKLTGKKATHQKP